MGTFPQRKFKGSTFDYFNMIGSREMKEWYRLIWYPFIRVYTPIKFDRCMPSDHVITSCHM